MASLEVVKSTAFFGPAQIINRTKSLKINILIGLNLINMVIKTNQISYSTLVWINYKHMFVSGQEQDCLVSGSQTEESEWGHQYFY